MKEVVQLPDPPVRPLDGLKGTFGTFTFFTDHPEEETRTVPGGEVIRIDAFNHFTELEIPGPVNTLRSELVVVTNSPVAPSSRESNTRKASRISASALVPSAPSVSST